MASQMDQDERLARQLQQEEQAQAGAQFQPVPVSGQAPIVQGFTVGGPGGGGQALPMAQVVGPGGNTMPVAQVVGMGQPGGMPYAVGGMPQGGQYAQGQYVAGQPVGMVQPGMVMMQPGGMPYAMDSGPEIPIAEMLILRYRFTMKCFSVIDAVSTAFNAMSPLMRMANSEDNEEEQSSRSFGTITGEDSIITDDRFALLGLIFLVGPVCGYLGAVRFQRTLVAVYLAFCLGKTAFEITIAIFTHSLWYILIALVQIWVTKIVFTFFRSLGAISKERLAQLSDPAYQPNVPTRIAYW